MEFNEAWDHACSSVGLACRVGNYEALKTLLKTGKTVDVQDNRGWRPVHEAAASNRVDCLKLVLEQEENDVNWKSFEGQTPLLLASMNGHAEIVQLLLLHGANPNVCNNEDESPLMYAVRVKNNFACVEKLLNAGANVNVSCFDGTTALHAALTDHCEDVKVVARLFEKGAKIDTRDDWGITPVFLAAQVGCVPRLEMLLQKAKEEGICSVIDVAAKDGATPLIAAVRHGFVDCVELLLRNGADSNKCVDNGMTALHLAVALGHLKCVQMLLEQMDDCVLKRCSLDTWDTFGESDLVDSPLHFAIHHKRHDVLKLLLKWGLDPNKMIGSTACCKSTSEFFFTNQLDYLPRLISPLGCAAGKIGAGEYVATLLEAGAEVNPNSSKVIHPLIPALIRGNVHAIEHLLLNGADPHCRSGLVPNFAWLPHLLILPVYDARILRLLLKHGADARRSFPPRPRDDRPDYFDTSVHGVEMFGITCNENSYDTVAVLQEFLGSRVPKRYVKQVHRKWLQDCDEDSFLPEDINVGEQCWDKVFETSKNPPPLVNLCRSKVRECLMDNNGSSIFPFSKLLDMLPPLPSMVKQFLAFN